MKDLLLNEEFEIELNDRNDLAMVDGTKQFHQYLRQELAFYMTEQIGSVDHPNARRRLRQQVRMLALESEFIQSLERVDVLDKVDEPGAFEVVIEYNLTEGFAMEIGE